MCNSLLCLFIVRATHSYTVLVKAAIKPASTDSVRKSSPVSTTRQAFAITTLPYTQVRVLLANTLVHFAFGCANSPALCTTDHFNCECHPQPSPSPRAGQDSDSPNTAHEEVKQKLCLEKDEPQL